MFHGVSSFRRLHTAFLNVLQSGVYASSPIFHQPCDTTHIAAASESAEIDPANIGLIDDLAAKFLDSLTPKEMGFLMYDNPQPLSLQEVDSDIREKYRAKYGTKNMKRGQFFRLGSGTITFFTHEHNLKFKVDN